MNRESDSRALKPCPICHTLYTDMSPHSYHSRQICGLKGLCCYCQLAKLCSEYQEMIKVGKENYVKPFPIRSPIRLSLDKDKL